MKYKYKNKTSIEVQVQNKSSIEVQVQNKIYIKDINQKKNKIYIKDINQKEKKIMFLTFGQKHGTKNARSATKLFCFLANSRGLDIHPWITPSDIENWRP